MQPSAEPGPWLDRVDALRQLGVTHLVVFAMDHTNPASWWVDYYGGPRQLLESHR